jgi:hypothetical protein
METSSHQRHRESAIRKSHIAMDDAPHRKVLHNASRAPVSHVPPMRLAILRLTSESPRSITRWRSRQSPFWR